MATAPHAALTGGPVSDAGRRLVNRICDAVEERERSVQVRKYARGPNMRIKFEKAIGAFVADVLRVRQSARADGWLSRSLRNDSFPAGGEFSWTTANHAVQGLQQLGLLEVVKGYTAFGTPQPADRRRRQREQPSRAQRPALRQRLPAELRPVALRSARSQRGERLRW